MRRSARTPVMLTFILGVLACSMKSHAQSAGALPGVDSTFNLVVVADGDVQLKREGWQDYHPTTFGAALHRGDQLWPAKGAKVIVLCGDFTTWTVPAGISSGLANGCPPPGELFLTHGPSRIGRTRGENDPRIPYIISPRKTSLLNDKPTLRWNPVPGANRYRVGVRGGGVNWQVSVSETAVVYPGKAPLKPGVTYLLSVEADDGGRSLEEGVADFSLLDENDARRVRAAAERLTQLTVPDEAKTFALASLYVSHNLIAEAVETLEALVAGGSQRGAVYRTLGDLYWRSGLTRLAEERYLQSVRLAQAAQDLEGEAAAQEGLGKVYEAIGNVREAAHWLDRARAGYQALGASHRAHELAQELEQLPKLE